jgi:hypothetical protein
MTKAGLDALGEALQQHSSLIDLEVIARDVVLDGDSEVWALAIERNKSLKKLVLCPGRVTASCSLKILIAMATNRTLKMVSLYCLELDLEGSVAAARVISDNETVGALCLGGTFRHGMKDKDAFYEHGMDVTPIAQALASNHSLKLFKLVGWGVQADGIKSLSHALMQNNTLGGLSLAFNIANVHGIAPLCLLVSQSTTLKGLDLSGSRIADKVLKVLCTAFKQNHSLEVLKLDCNTIGDEGASALADLLLGNTSLKVFGIGRINISDDGCVTLGRALHQNTTLEGLNMSHNKSVGDRGTRALLDGVRAHPALTRVELPGTPNDSQKAELQFYFERNKGPRVLLKANIPLSLWPRALKRADGYRYNEDGVQFRAPDMLYFLVKEKSEELFQNAMTGNRPQKVVRRGRTNKRKRKRTE